MSFARPSPTSRASRLGQPELNVLRGEAEVAGERELQADAEDVALQARDHGLRAALRRGDVLRELRDLPRRALEEARDVAAGCERAAGARDDDERDGVVAVELGEDRGELVARRHRDPVELARHVQRDRRDRVVALHPEPVVVRHPVAPVSSRSILRRIFPEADFGSAST